MHIISFNRRIYKKQGWIKGEVVITLQRIQTSQEVKEGKYLTMLNFGPIKLAGNSTLGSKITGIYFFYLYSNNNTRINYWKPRFSNNSVDDDDD